MPVVVIICSTVQQGSEGTRLVLISALLFTSYEKQSKPTDLYMMTLGNWNRLIEFWHLTSTPQSQQCNGMMTFCCFLSVSLFVCLSVCLFICLYVCLFISLYTNCHVVVFVFVCVWAHLYYVFVCMTRCQIWCTIELHRDPISKVLLVVKWF